MIMIVGVDTEFDGENGSKIPFLVSSCDEYGYARIYRMEDQRDVQKIKELCEDEDVTKVCHPQTVEQLTLSKVGIQIRGAIEDTFIASSLVESSSERIGLKQLWRKYYGETETAKSLKQAISKYKRRAKNEGRQFSWLEIDRDLIEPYAIDDAVYTVGLWKGQYQKRIWKFRKLYEFERDKVLPILSRSQQYGMMIDRQFVKAMCVEYEDEIEVRRQRMQAILKQNSISLPNFNPNSDDQIRFIYEKMEVVSPKVTKGGKASFDKEVLSELAANGNQFAQQLNEHNFFEKQYGSYFCSLRDTHSSDQYPYAHFLIFQVGARTGRMSAELIQTIPKPEESVVAHVEKVARRSFIPRPGYTLVSCDYKTIEMILFLDQANALGPLEKIKNGWDAYEATAEIVFGAGQGKSMRKAAKTIALGKIYGLGLEKLIRQTKLNRWDAIRAVRQFESVIPVRQYMSQMIREIYHDGFVVLGVHSDLMDVYRHYEVPKDLAYKIVNYKTQGWAAYFLKFGMVRSDNMIRQKGYDAHLLVPVHDELLFEVKNEEVKYFRKDIREVMEDHVTCKAPVRITIKESDKSWGKVEEKAI